MNLLKKQLTGLNDFVKANDLNYFFLRFDAQNPHNPLMDEVSDLVSGDLDCVVIDPKQVQTVFRNVCNKKSMGPDGLPASLLKCCSAELTDAWCPIFQKSIQSQKVPELWKKSIVIPIPKVSCPIVNKDFRPVSLTCTVMKCFEKVIVNMIKPVISSRLDSLQFAYREGRSTEDADHRCPLSQQALGRS